MNDQQTLLVAQQAVARACVACRHVAARLVDEMALTKGDRSPVTVADFASQALVVRHLRAHLGDLTIVGEEDADALRRGEHAGLLAAVVEAVNVASDESVSADEVLGAIDAGHARDADGSYWTLDPIDGTKGFLRGGQYAVSLAYVDAGGPALGVLGCPALGPGDASPQEVSERGTVFAARRGHAPLEFPEDGGTLGDGREIGLGERPVQTLVVAESVESGHTRHDHTQAIIEHLGWSGDHVRLDGQGKYAVVARGQAHAYFRMPTRPGYRERVWDHAAGVLVAQCAGARVSDIHGHDLDFSTPPALERNRGVIVASPETHERIIAAIAELGMFLETP